MELENYQTGFTTMLCIMTWETLIRELTLLDLLLVVQKFHILEDVAPAVFQLILVCFLYCIKYYVVGLLNFELATCNMLLARTENLMRCVTDMLSESRVEKPKPMYVPRDEQFEESKMDTFSFGRLKGVLHNLLPSLMSSFKSDKDFRGFADIDSLYSEGVLLKLGVQEELLKKFPLPKMVSKFQDYNQGILKYDIPHILSSEFRRHDLTLLYISSADENESFINATL